jgi:hypothetical protein
MSARRKLETLTHAWYGYAVFVTALSFAELVLGGGIFGIIFGFLPWLFISGIGLVLSILISHWLGALLLARSGGVRFVLVLLSGLCTVLGVFGAASAAWGFLTTFRLGALVHAVVITASTYMNARSFKTLNESDVRAYFTA